MKLTVFCLLALGVLTFLGTIYQVEHGLYAAQEKFFNSYWLFYGPVPLPSARTIIWLLSLNLITTLIFNFRYSWKKLGLVIMHMGMLLLLASGFLTMHFSQESFLSVLEGERSAYSEDYYNWELFIRESDINNRSSDKIISLKDLDSHKSDIQLEYYYPNSQLFHTPFAGDIIKEMPPSKEYETNIPALKLKASETSFELQGQSQPSFSMENESGKLLYILRRKRYKLPFSLELIDISRDLHAGTQIAKSYKSRVKIHENNSDITRELNISMNKPFRLDGYTAYQSSYGVSASGVEQSVFAIVKNSNYTLPYIATLLAALGMFIHFVMAFLDYARKRSQA